MRDFTLIVYRRLLNSLLETGYSFYKVEGFFQEQKNGRVAVMRHDVDRLPENALAVARLENEFGIGATYYFRTVRKVFNENIIREIAGFGHEIGYHYENMDRCGGDVERAYDDFRANLEKFRRICPVKTVCMHGSPMSRHDNRDLWKKFSYRDLGIVAEPYFDVNFSDVLYLTDTGRRWDGEKVSVRDKIGGNRRRFGLRLRWTADIIAAAKKGVLPDKVMINTHPQRWDARPLPWARELVWQNVKNFVKRFV